MNVTSMFTGAVAASFALAAVLSGSRAGATAAAFSPQAVFALPDRDAIDDRCGDAKHFAATAAKGLDGIDPQSAVAAEKAFVACIKLPRLNPDIDQMRYMLLAAGAALFVAAQKTTGETSAKLYEGADLFAAELGATAPDRSISMQDQLTGTPSVTGQARDNVIGQQTNSAPGSGNGPMRYSPVTVRDPMGGPQAEKFRDVAQTMRVAIEAALDAPEAPRQQQVATPAPAQGAGAAPGGPAAPK